MTDTADSQPTQNFYGEIENIIGIAYGDIIHYDYSMTELSPEISKIIITLQDIASKFPPDIKNGILVQLNDLKSDLSKPGKNRQTISTRLSTLLVTAALVGGGVAEATDFTNNVLQLKDRLGVPVQQK